PFITPTNGPWCPKSVVIVTTPEALPRLLIACLPLSESFQISRRIGNYRVLSHGLSAPWEWFLQTPAAHEPPRRASPGSRPRHTRIDTRRRQRHPARRAHAMAMQTGRHLRRSLPEYRLHTLQLRELRNSPHRRPDAVQGPIAHLPPG